MAFIFSLAERVDIVNTHLSEILVFDRLALRDSLHPPPPPHLCPGLNAVTNFANFTNFRLTLQDLPLLQGFFGTLSQIYDFMLIDQQATAFGFYKIYKMNDFSLPSLFFSTSL